MPLQFRALARPRHGDDGVVLGDHAEIAVIGFRRMDEEGRRAGRGERGGDLGADMAAFADAGDDDAAVDRAKPCRRRGRKVRRGRCSALRQAPRRRPARWRPFSAPRRSRRCLSSGFFIGDPACMADAISALPRACPTESAVSRHDARRQAPPLNPPLTIPVYGSVSMARLRRASSG